MRTDPAWDEYLSTGIDPTGGELEEAAPSKSYQPKPPQRNKPQKPSRSGIIFWCAVLCLFLICLASSEKHKAENEQARIKNESYQEAMYQQRQLEQLRRDSINAYWKHRDDSLDAVSKAKEKAAALERMEKSAAENRAKLEREGPAATFDQGFKDGYECGHDDSDCGESYGNSWMSDAVIRYYSKAYQEGFKTGYAKGYKAGSEDFDYINEY